MAANEDRESDVHMMPGMAKDMPREMSGQMPKMAKGQGMQGKGMGKGGGGRGK